jgi:serine/threonine protein kinase
MYIYKLHSTPDPEDKFLVSTSDSEMATLQMESLGSLKLDELEILEFGAFALVYRIPGTDKVFKKSHYRICEGHRHHDNEVRIYERLGHHPYVLRYYGVTKADSELGEGRILQYQPAGTLFDFLSKPKEYSQYLDASKK